MHRCLQLMLDRVEAVATAAPGDHQAFEDLEQDLGDTAPLKQVGVQATGCSQHTSWCIIALSYYSLCMSLCETGLDFLK